MSGDTVSFWLQNAGRVPLLTAAQEITYGNQVRAWLDAENPDARTIRRGQRARERMVSSNLKLAVAVAKRYTKRIVGAAAIGFEDLCQESVIGLVRAVEKFDPAKGYKLSTYAYWWCQQGVNRCIQQTANTIRTPVSTQEIVRRWRYRPEGQTLEEFAESQGKTPKKIMECLRLADAAQTYSLDCKVNGADDESSTLMDFVSHDDPDIVDHDYVDAMQHLMEVDDGVLRDALAMLELQQHHKPAEMAELMGCSTKAAKVKLNDMKALVREHCPTHIREQILGKEKSECVKLDEIVPAVESSPAQELVMASSCSTATQSMPEAIAPHSTNGHHKAALEQKAAAVIAEVQLGGEASEEALKPTKRRRAKAEITTEKVAQSVSLTIEGIHYEGKPEDIAAVLRALKAA